METSVSIQQKEIPDSAAVQLTWLPQSLGVAAVTMGQTFSHSLAAVPSRVVQKILGLGLLVNRV